MKTVENVKNFLKNPKNGLPIAAVVGLLLGIGLSYISWVSPAYNALQHQAHLKKVEKEEATKEKEKYVSLQKQLELTYGSKDIATWKGGSLTRADFYDSAKINSTNQSLVRELIVYDVFEAAYGDKVKDSEILAKFNEVKKQQGDNFESALQQAGLTEVTYKEKVKDQLALEQGLKEHIKLSYGDSKATTEEKLKDQSFVTKVIGEELKKANAQIKDDAFKSVLDDFTGNKK